MKFLIKRCIIQFKTKMKFNLNFNNFLCRSCINIKLYESLFYNLKLFNYYYFYYFYYYYFIYLFFFFFIYGFHYYLLLSSLIYDYFG